MKFLRNITIFLIVLLSIPSLASAQSSQVCGTGKIIKILKDDTIGSKHQRFVVHTRGKDITFAHNIDIAKRVENIKVNNYISYCGEIVGDGKVIHWTHKSKNKKHKNGYLLYMTKIYD